MRRCLVNRANNWLRSNPDVTVRTCQTVTWSSHDLRTLASPSGAVGELMVLSRGLADNALTYHLRGLRYNVMSIIVYMCSACFSPSPTFLSYISKYAINSLCQC